ncbi:MAG: MFS transporter [Comamonadaceae bacterium]|nr:MFS transporter [Comamonadaceae bacterium]
MITKSTQPHTAERHRAWVESLYERLAEDDEGRVCKAISESACREAPGNFMRTLVANTLSNIADRLASAKTTLPWLLLQLGAPAWMLSLLVPIRESGSMLPQMAIGAWVRQQAVRKWVWVWGGVVQALCLAALGWVGANLSGATAGWAVISLLVVFSLARGACSVAYKDVQGKTVPKTRRGRLAGWISAVSGLAALAVGVGLGFVPGEESTALVVGLLLAGGVLWALASLAFSRIVEEPGATEGGANGITEALAQLSVLRDDAPFRRFVIARALAMGSGLAAPFYLALARDDLGQAMGWLGVFIAVEGLASLVSSPAWGRWADSSSRQVFATACALAALLSIGVAAGAWADLPPGVALVFYPLAFFGLGVAHAGIRLGRKTYLVDMADGNQRTVYVAVSNSVIGALLLFTGLVGAMASLVSVPGTVLLLGLAGLAGSAMSLRWKEISG